MATVWGTTGPDLQVINVPTAGQGNVTMEAIQVADDIAPGDYDGQPVKWDGAAYVPLPLGQYLVYSGISIYGEVQVRGLDPSDNGGILLVSAAVCALDNNFGGEVRIASTGGHVFAYPFGYTGISVPVNSTGFIGAPDSGGNAQLMVTTGLVADVPAIGFLGADVVVRQSITGATTQDQVDSLVTALVALGLVTDDR